MSKVNAKQQEAAVEKAEAAVRRAAKAPKEKAEAAGKVAKKKLKRAQRKLARLRKIEHAEPKAAEGSEGGGAAEAPAEQKAEA